MISVTSLTHDGFQHQGMTFKTNDKKVTTSKNLVQEIETLRRDQQQKRVSLSWDPATSLPLRPQHQFELQVDDFDVLFDVLKLAFSFLDRAVTPYNAKERAAIEETLRKMIPLIFSIDEKNVEANLAPAIQFDGDQDAPEPQESDDDGADMSDTAASASDSSAATGRKGTKRTAADLRKKLLSTTANGHIAKTAERAEETSPDDASDDAPIMPSLEKGTWIAASPHPWPSLPPSTPRTPRSPSKFKAIPHPSPVAQQPRAQKEQEASSLTEPRFNFFAGQSFYCFFRLFHVSLPCFGNPCASRADRVPV
jgi:paired amphipathic helix protein Sin3a